jgi:Flp pilus assembly pilin Flp
VRPRWRLADSRGASLVEYLVIVGVIAVVALGAARYLGQRVDAKAEQQAACIGSLACGANGQAAIGEARGAATPAADAPVVAPDATLGGDGGKAWWQRGLDVGKGFVLGAWDTVTGLVHVVMHPVQTVESAWAAVTHPVTTYHAIKDGVVAAWNDNPEEVIGRGLFEVVTLPLAAAKASKLKLVGGAARGTEVAEDASTVARTVDEAGDATALAKGAVVAQKEVAALTDVASPRLAVYQESVRRAASIESLAEARYGAEIGLASLGKIRGALGARYEVLVSDPGIVMRLDDFLAFAAKQDLASMAPWELRELYSKHLGTANVYRGLALTEDQAKAMQTEGMFAGYLRPDATGNAAWSQGDPFSQNFYSMMKERIHGGGWGPISAAPNQPVMDALMSVTYQEDVALLVTGGLVKQIGRPDVKMYIYRIDLPKLDLLPGPVFDRLPTYVNNDELFAPFRIRPEEIISMEGPLEPRMIDLGK